jgi:hypothetical protein
MVKMADPSKWCSYEPTLSDILSEPIVRALMEADGVDPRELDVMLRSVAAALVPQKACPRDGGGA